MCSGDKTKMRASRCCQLLMLLTVFLNSPARAQQSETAHEVWPELDIYVPISERFRLFLMASEEKSGEEGSSQKAHVGAHLDYFWKQRWTLRAGYRYGF